MEKIKLTLPKTPIDFLKVVLPIVLALVSIFFVSKPFTNVETYNGTIEALDESKTDVLELMTSSTAASAAITILPGDVATPIAEKLADVSSYFMIVLCALYLEKFLLTIIGYVSLIVIVPLGCLMFSISEIAGKPSVKIIALKFIVFGILIMIVIPVSVMLSSTIRNTYGQSIDEVIENAKATVAEAQESTEGIEESEEDENFWDSLTSAVKEKVSVATDKFEKILNNMLEALAVLIVTSCLIPIFVIVLFIWIIKQFFNIEGSIIEKEKIKAMIPGIKK